MKTIIIGGGLSGLYAAYLLEKQQQDYLLLEANQQFGGRAKGIQISPQHQLELGATWYWKDYQPALHTLIQTLGLTHFDQPTGKILIEQQRNQAPKIIDYPYIDGQRLVGGMSQLIDALQQQLPSERLKHNTKVEKIEQNGDEIRVYTTQDTYHAQRILLAIPPRLAVANIQFIPELPTNTLQQWQQTPTWMAPHAKFIAQYSSPFWHQQGLSGDARSQIGPMAEIHDISDPQGKVGAIFGFLAYPVQMRQQFSEDALKQRCLEQLIRLFGEQAAHPQAVYLKDWAMDPLTAVEKDWQATLQHPKPAQSPQGQWQDKLLGISSEFSPTFPGILGGAIEAVDIALG